MVIVELNLFEKLSEIISFLTELDSKHSIHCQNMQDSIKSLSRLKRISKTLKLQLLNLEKQYMKDYKFLQSGFEEIITVMNSSHKKKNYSPEICVTSGFREKIEKILKGLIPGTLISSFEKSKNFNSQVTLLPNFTKISGSEEPEIELNSESENKKLMNHVHMLRKTLEKIAADLLKLWLHKSELVLRDPKSDLKIFEDPKLGKSISPNDLKMLKLKINRLHNRGSLTDEEARNMLGKISIIPTSPNHNDTENITVIKGNLEFSTDIICDENPVTETREKQEKLGASFTKDMNKKIKSLKTNLKRPSTPAKRILRNTSLPKAVSLAKYKNKDKAKGIKAKAKSPHSFM